MTLGPELMDLSDDAGNLRPEVARIIAAAPDRPIPPAPEPAPAAAPPPPPVQAPPVAPVAERPWRAAAPPRVDRVPPAMAAARVAFPQRPVRQLTLTIPDFAATRVSFVSMLVVAAVAAFAAGLIGVSVGLKGIGRLGVVPNLDTVTPTTTAATPASPSISTPAFVNGVNVNMRTGPGLGFPVATRLMPGEGLTIREGREGWCSVITAAGISGWVYGALIRGRNLPGEKPAIVRRLFVTDGFGARVILRPGQKVLRLTNSDGTSTVLLPDGRRIAVPPEVLVDAD